MLEEVRKTYSSVAKLLGVFKTTHPKLRKIQRTVSRVFNLNTVLLNVFYFTNLVETRGDTLLQIHIGLQWVIVISYSISYFFFTTHQKEMEKCLNWCEGFHATGAATRWHFESCGQMCVKVVKMTVKVAFYFTVISVIAFQLTESLMSGHYEPFLPLYLPFVSHSNVPGLIFCTFNHILAFISFLTPVYSSMAFIFVIVSYSETTMEYLRTILMDRNQSFPQRVKLFMQMFCRMNEVLGILTRLMNPFLMAFEISGYCDLLIVWVVIMFNPESLLFVLSFVEEFGMFVVVCWLNEKLIKAYEDLRTFLFELEWEELRPRDRKLLLLVMMSVENQKVLQAGPFHRLDFLNLGLMLNRAYKGGTVVGKFIKGQ